MEKTYEISIYVQDDDANYAYVSIWRGESRREAMKLMDKYANGGVGCIKLEYRPYEPNSKEGLKG